jgi:titin
MSGNAGQSWTTVATTNGNSTTVTGLSNGLNYLFRVAATNRGGTGPVSPVGAVTPRTVAGPPTITTATAGSQQVALAWTVPANNGSPIVRYVVDFSSDGGGSWTRREGNASPSAIITGLANGTSYVFRVAAVNAEGVGAFSPQTGQVIPLGAPISLIAAPGNRSAWLAWTAADAGSSSAVNNYRIELSGNGGLSWTQAATVPGNVTTTQIIGLSNGAGYTFRVAAVANQAPGVLSESSNEVFPAASVGSPTRVTAALNNGAVSLRWTAPRTPRGARIDDYVIQYTTDNGLSWTNYEDGISVATRAVITGLPTGAQYRFRVAAVTGELIGDVSAATRAVLLYDRRATPAAPTNLSAASLGNGRYLLTWNAVAGNAGGAVNDYVIHYRVNSPRGSRWVMFKDPVSAATSATLTGLTNRNGYVVRVAARNLAGIGAWAEITIQ